MKKTLRTACRAALATATALAALVPAQMQADDFTEGANTYIVTSAGTHTFVPVHTDGTPIDIAKADWLWAEKDPTETAQGMLSNVRLQDGKVSFDYSGNREGTAVIAGFDEEGTVVWTWLIWCTDRPVDVKLSNGTYFQDRLLGAVGSSQDGVTQHQHPEAWSPIGYQWGRTVPIFNGYNAETFGVAMSEPKQYTQINPAYADTFAWTVDLSKSVSLEESFANPTTWYTKNNDTDSWYEQSDFTLWAETEKTIYDPCPEGYKVPCEQDFGDFGSEAVLASIYGFTYTNDEGETSWWRGCGSGRYYGDGKYDAMASASSTPIYYWLTGTFVYSGGYTYPKRLMLQTDPAAMKMVPFSGGLPSLSYNVRCVRYKGEPVTSVGKAAKSLADVQVKTEGTTVVAYFPAGQRATLTLTDAAGRTIAAAKGTSGQLSLRTAGPGFYLVKATSGAASVSHKVVVK